MNLAIGWNQDQPYVVFLVFHNMVFYFFLDFNPFKEEGEHTILELFYNWKHKHMLLLLKMLLQI